MHYLLADDLVIIVHALVIRVAWARYLARRKPKRGASKERAELIDKVQQDSPQLLKPVPQQAATEIIARYVTLYFQDEFDNWDAGSRVAVQTTRSRVNAAVDQLVEPGGAWHTAHTVAGFISEQMDTREHEISSAPAFLHSLELLDVLWAVCNLVKKQCAVFVPATRGNAKRLAEKPPNTVDSGIIQAVTVQDVTLDHENGSKLEDEDLHLNIAAHAMVTASTTKDERTAINNYVTVCQDYARTGDGRQLQKEHSKSARKKSAGEIAGRGPGQLNALRNTEAAQVEAKTCDAIFLGLWPRQQWVRVHRPRQVRGWFIVLYADDDQQVHVGIAERTGAKSYHLVSKNSLSAEDVKVTGHGNPVAIINVEDAPTIKSKLYPEDMDDLKRHFRIPTHMTTLFHLPPERDAFLGPPRCQNCLTASCARTNNESLSCDTCPKHGVQYLHRFNDATYVSGYEFDKDAVVAGRVEIVCIACMIGNWNWTATHVNGIKKHITKARSTLWCASECSDNANARPPHSVELGSWEPSSDQKTKRAYILLNHIRVIDPRDYKLERGSFGKRSRDENQSTKGRSPKRGRGISP